jgi:nitrite reductase/ring-hydroxylating ferredoxin subunit
MLVRIDNAKDIAPGEMHVFDVEGIKVNVASVGGRLHAFRAVQIKCE